MKNGMGSSPRMRGTHGFSTFAKRNDGIIPAYAGNTWTAPPARPANRDHPRVCGEHQSAPTEAVQREGSSPRMRGTRSYPFLSKLSAGIIPAYAGNTTISSICLHSARNHPRVCGEHFRQLSAAQKRAGSSPRMRGTPSDLRLRLRYGGIIPAYAGNTGSLVPSPRNWRDHPRVCGEHHIYRKNLQRYPGSSPRMRGTPLYSARRLG